MGKAMSSSGLRQADDDDDGTVFLKWNFCYNVSNFLVCVSLPRDGRGVGIKWEALVRAAEANMAAFIVPSADRVAYRLLLICASAPR